MMTDLGIWFGEFISPILSLLKIDGVGPLLALGLIVLGLLIGTIFTIKFSIFIRELKEAIHAVGEFDSEEDFAEKFESVDEYFSSRRGLSQCWREFTESIIYPHASRSGGDREVIRNTARPFEFFDANAAGFTTPNLKIWPNIFVGLGLVLTFAGLITALTTAVEGMDGATEAMQRSLVDLLRVTSAKFYTSLMALGVSIGLTIHFKFLEVWRDGLFKKLADKIERGMVYVSVEEVAYQQLVELREQKLQLQEFNTDLAMKLGSHIREAVSDAMNPVVEKLTNMGENMGQNNLEAMQGIGEAIAKNVQGAAGESLGHLSDRLDSLTTVLGDMATNLSKSTGQFEADIASSLEGMKKGMEDLAQHLQTNAAKTSDMLGEKLEKLADSLSNASNDIKTNLQEGASQVSGELENAISKLASATDDSATKMSEAVSGIKDSVSSISSALDNVSNEASTTAKEKIEEAGQAVAKQVNDAGKSMADSLESHMDELKVALNGFESSLDTASSNLSNMAVGLDKTSDSLRDASSSIDKSVNSMEGVSTKIETIIRPAMQASEAIKSSISQMEQKVSQSVILIGESVNKLEEEMRLNGKSWEEHSGKFEGVNEKLGIVFERVNGQIEESQKRMSEFVVNLDGAFNSAIAGLQGAVEDLADERKPDQK